MKYIFGVMSNKMELEADDLIIAKSAMLLHYRNPDIPIAIYEPVESAFLPREFIKDVSKEPHKVIKAFKSIKVLK